MQGMQRNPTLVLPSQQMFHKLGFVQKLGCQKPCWDQARLSSLLNKQSGEASRWRVGYEQGLPRLALSLSPM